MRLQYFIRKLYARQFSLLTFDNRAYIVCSYVSHAFDRSRNFEMWHTSQASRGRWRDPTYHQPSKAIRPGRPPDGHWDRQGDRRRNFQDRPAPGSLASTIIGGCSRMSASFPRFASIRARPQLHSRVGQPLAVVSSQIRDWGAVGSTLLRPFP
jgi:hypothetical protein